MSYSEQGFKEGSKEIGQQLAPELTNLFTSDNLGSRESRNAIASFTFKAIFTILTAKMAEGMAGGLPASTLTSKGGIALGKDIPGKGLKALAQQTESSWWRNWAKDGITRRTVDNRFGRAFHQAVERAKNIHFSLDGIDDVATAIRSGKKGFIQGNMTNAELEYLSRNTDLLKKTIFYRNGMIVESPFK